MAKNNLTSQRLKSLIEYNPETGIFTRIAKTCSSANRLPLGVIAGSPSDNQYLRIGVDGGRYFAHRLAYLYMNGTWPTADVDHKNRDRTDNRWSNLRDATRCENMQNTVVSNKSTTGVKGVCLNRKTGKWVCRFKANKTTIYLGTFAVFEDAVNAYNNEVTKHHTHLPKQAG